MAIVLIGSIHIYRLIFHFFFRTFTQNNFKHYPLLDVTQTTENWTLKINSITFFSVSCGVLRVGAHPQSAFAFTAPA